MHQTLHLEMIRAREHELAAAARRAASINQVEIGTGRAGRERRVTRLRWAAVIAVIVIAGAFTLAGTAFARTSRTSLVKRTGVHTLVKRTSVHTRTGDHTLVKRTSVHTRTGAHSVRARA